MTRRKPSPACDLCKHQPTKRVYTKYDGIQRGIAWICAKCKHFQLDEEAPLYL